MSAASDATAGSSSAEPTQKKVAGTSYFRRVAKI